MSLERYAVDPNHGFLPGIPPLRELPAPFAPWEAIVPDMSALIRSRRLRRALERLPLLDAAALQTSAERERGMLLLSHFVNGWVWGGAEPHLRIPAAVAVPLCALAETLGRPPIAHYASMTLNNWQLLDPSAPLSIDNARTQVNFLGGVDEDWFFIASMGVELAGAPLLPIVAAADRASRDASDGELARELEAYANGMDAVLQALHRIREWCNPATYYLRVRPYVTGWPAPGAVYEGVSEEPKKYLGGSAAQSSLLQVFDALLGLAHPDVPAGKYLRAVRDYMPPLHRAFVEDIERSSRVRDRAIAGAAPLRDAYNASLAQMERFRDAHMQLAHDFIIRPSGENSAHEGTGGTALNTFLRGAQGTTTAAKL
ncbi:MAG: hypothetical protein IT360_02175 [Gemmatimonadaceae bacterium]|nr:hypothetical protein [Gemmatimonadaceae bacterium]